MSWNAAALGNSDLQMVPGMQTDVSLRSSDRTIIIECKYTNHHFQSRVDRETLRSSHLYQLCTYLRAVALNGGADETAEGILLYPSAGQRIDQSFLLHGHRVTIRTVDLSQHWTGIEEQMLSLIRRPH